MPELPEVETVRRGLQKFIVGRQVKTVDFDTPKSFPNGQADVTEFLVGAHIIAIARRAKVLIIDLDSDYSLVIHLKMTGQLVYVKEGFAPPLDSEVNSESSLHPLKLARSARVTAASMSRQANFRGRGEDGTLTLTSSGGENPSLRFGAGHPNKSLVGELPDKSTRVTLTFKDDSKLFFNDQRKFGWMKLFPTIEVPNIDFMQRVGPEPLEDSFTAKEFISRIRRHNGTTIKAAILDQTVLAGVGNIYADESLWAAKIHPATRARDVTDDQLAQLLADIKAVMTLSIEKGGSTDRNYVDAEGKKGSYLTFANVFRREGQPCPRCATIITKHKIAARGTHICQQCQVMQP